MPFGPPADYPNGPGLVQDGAEDLYTTLIDEPVAQSARKGKLSRPFPRPPDRPTTRREQTDAHSLQPHRDHADEREEDDGHGIFCHDERATQPPPVAGPAAALLQGGIEIGP